jgi:hypothetical protein
VSECRDRDVVDFSVGRPEAPSPARFGPTRATDLIDSGEFCIVRRSADRHDALSTTIVDHYISTADIPD